MRWVPSREDEAAAEAAPDGAPAAVDETGTGGTSFHFIRRGKVGEGKERFTPEQDAAFAAMLERTFPDGLPGYMADLV